MATFEATRSMNMQTHFEVLEVDLPVITGACTVGGSPGFGTPLTCDQAWTGEYETYKFTNENAPILAGSPWRLIQSISETTTELKPGDGLSSRGSLKIVFSDNDRQDPNVDAPGVTSAIRRQGTFFGKLAARQIFENKAVRLKLYRVQQDGTIDLVNGAETRYYIANSFVAGSNGTWTLTCKDVLSLANLNEKTWPIPTQSFLRQDIDDSQTIIQVDNETDYSNIFAVRIGDEFMRITGVDTSIPSDHKIQVAARGFSLIAPISGELLTTTTFDDHSAGDEVFLCELSDDESIDSLLTRVLVDSDFDVSLIPTAEWAAEVAEWHPNDKINTLHSESESVNDVLKKILTGFLMDLWFSTTENKAKLSAISVWKQSSSAITEGKEINAYTITKKPQDSMRASRALVVYDKRNLADDDSVASYKKASQFSDNSIIGPELFGKHKDKLFESNQLIGTDAADLLVQRYVSRFKFTPFIRTFMTDEHYLNFKTGDVVDIMTTVDLGVNGLPSANVRAQILKINPQYTKEGRIYKVSAMTYEAAFGDNAEIVLDSPLSESNLYILAGAPSQAVTITFVLTAYSFGSTGFRAGAFPAGSKIILILINGFDGQASGGNGGDGESITQELIPALTWLSARSSGSGGDGGTVYNAQGVDTDIYFSGVTPSVANPIADGYIRAPGAGGKGTDSNESGTTTTPGFAGNSGGGGAGRPAGIAGDRGKADYLSDLEADTFGGQALNGDIIGNGGITNDIPQGFAAEAGGDWGVSTGSAISGSGIIDSGATVTLFGSNATRYINGAGDHP
ncbi:MAG: hypothetical protein JKY81_05635 [Colwellia sp.]|nr:hypothetical protein [Colwellia sp.]